MSKARVFDRAFKLSAVHRMLAGANVSALSRELAVLRKDLYVWRERFRAGGPAALRGRGRPSKASLTALASPSRAPPDPPTKGAASPALAQARRRIDVRLEEEFAYLAVVLDAFSRRVIGWALADHLQASLAVAALEMALSARRPAPGSLIHHSDRGVQYAYDDYTALLTAHDIRASMSRIGNPYDNAKAESFMKTLKQEEVDGRAYRDVVDARASIGAFIERVYNSQRLHSALGYRPPAEYEADFHAKSATIERDAAMGFQGMGKSTAMIEEKSHGAP
jgi:transposase InsO family protein